MRKRHFVGFILIGAAMFALNLLAFERSQAQVAPARIFRYSVKFVCGKSPGQGVQVVAAGTYFTAINVHNPQQAKIDFRKKIVVALPNEKAGPVSNFFDATLRDDEALEIDCDDIYKHIRANASFLKGFVVIESKTELDVVTVYTAAGATGQIETMDVERSEPRRVPPRREPDLFAIAIQPENSYCWIDNQGRLEVRIRNGGLVRAEASRLTVEFFGIGQSVTVATPAIPPNVEAIVRVPFPTGCSRTDCEFKIVIDSAGQVSESDELNNVVVSECRR